MVFAERYVKHVIFTVWRVSNGHAVDRQHERPWERGEQALDSLVCIAGLIFACACMHVCGRDGSHLAL